MTVSLSLEDYMELHDDSNGICRECGEIQYGGVEPDAEGYECEACGAMAVQGLENALMDGIVG